MDLAECAAFDQRHTSFSPSCIRQIIQLSAELDLATIVVECRSRPPLAFRLSDAVEYKVYRMPSRRAISLSQVPSLGMGPYTSPWD